MLTHGYACSAPHCPSASIASRRASPRLNRQPWLWRKPRTSSLNGPGASRLLTCPQLGITARAAPGIRRSNSSATDSGDGRRATPDQLCRHLNGRQHLGEIGLCHRGQRRHHAVASDISRHRLHEWYEESGWLTREEPGQGRIERVIRLSQRHAHGGQPGVCLLGAQRPPPPGVTVSQHHAADHCGMASIHLEEHGRTPRKPDDRRWRADKRADHGGEAIGVVGEAELVGYVLRSAGAGLVPSDHCELVGECVELWCPGTAVLDTTVHEHDRWPVPGAAIGEAEAMDLDRLHGRDGTPDVTAGMDAPQARVTGHLVRRG